MTVREQDTCLWDVKEHRVGELGAHASAQGAQLHRAGVCRVHVLRLCEGPARVEATWAKRVVSSVYDDLEGRRTYTAMSEFAYTGRCGG